MFQFKNKFLNSSPSFKYPYKSRIFRIQAFLYSVVTLRSGLKVCRFNVSLLFYIVLCDNKDLVFARRNPCIKTGNCISQIKRFLFLFLPPPLSISLSLSPHCILTQRIFLLTKSYYIISCDILY